MKLDICIPLVNVSISHYKVCIRNLIEGEVDISKGRGQHVFVHYVVLTSDKKLLRFVTTSHCVCLCD